jgi:tetratricopeptide (TPR) repeat protein
LLLMALACRKLDTPDMARAWLDRGMARLDEKKADRALLRLAAEALVINTDQNPDDSNAFARRARMMFQVDEREASALYERRFEERGQDPGVLIARGRMFAEAGKAEEAQRDFTRAAELSRDQLDRFVQAGWWLVGTYPAGLSTKQPPETDPDPSKPVKDAAGTKDLSWRPIVPDSLGRVNLRTLHNADNVSAYLLTYIHSPDDRTTSLALNFDDRCRVWLNGALIHENSTYQHELLKADRIPVTLKAGRNTLLLKIENGTGDYSFQARLADHPFDRGLALAALGLWEDAAPLWEQAFANTPPGTGDLWLQRVRALLMLAAGDISGYREHVPRSPKPKRCTWHRRAATKTPGGSMATGTTGSSPASCCARPKG